MNTPFYLKQKHQDFELFCESVKNWDLEYMQIDTGKFSSDLLLAGNHQFQFTHASLNRNILQRGASPVGLITFGLLADPAIYIHWRNIDVTDNKLFVFPENGELNSITNADFNVFVISAHEETINQHCATAGLPDIQSIIKNNEVFECDRQKISDLRQWLKEIRDELASIQGKVLTNSRVSAIESVFIIKLLSILSDTFTPAYPPRLRRRDNAVNIATDYIHTHYNNNISVFDLCQIARVSERTLEYAFMERFGIGPKRYLQVYRLNTVKKQLINGELGKISISETARLHGFWHMSKFAEDYRKLFLEKPSRTLVKSI